MSDQKSIVTIKISAAIAAATALSLLAITPVNAQSTLQNSAGGVQNQANQTQNTANTQNQTGTLQENNSTSTLSDPTRKPLGVVSDPSQATPDAVVQPSNTLKTDLTKTGKGLNWLIVSLILLAVMMIYGVYLLRSGKVQEAIAEIEEDVEAQQELAEAETVKAPKKKKTTKKKRKKPNQR